MDDDSSSLCIKIKSIASLRGLHKLYLYRIEKSKLSSFCFRDILSTI